MENLINKFKNLPNDQIGQNIYIAFEWSRVEGQDRKLTRIYLGSKTNGPMLQWFKPSISYDDDYEYEIEVFGFREVIKPYYLYDGIIQREFPSGGWTNLYSRGDFGNKFAHGGHWCSHTKNRHPRINVSPSKNKTIELLNFDGVEPLVLPSGIKGNVSATSMDCSGSWTIFFDSAMEALNQRLTTDEINETMPDVYKRHLLKNETQSVLDSLRYVLEAYEL